MGIPGKRVSRSKTRRRRANLALTKIHLVKCSKCSKPTRPHRVCPFCGHYQGKEIIKLKAKKTKTDKHKH